MSDSGSRRVFDLADLDLESLGSVAAGRTRQALEGRGAFGRFRHEIHQAPERRVDTDAVTWPRPRPSGTGRRRTAPRGSVGVSQARMRAVVGDGSNREASMPAPW